MPLPEELIIKLPPKPLPTDATTCPRCNETKLESNGYLL